MQDGDAGLRGVQLVTGIAAVVLLVVVGVTGALLTWRYVPTGGPEHLLAAGPRWSSVLVRRHEAGLGFGLLSTLVWGIPTAMIVFRSRPTALRRAVALTAAFLAVALTLLTFFSWRLVAWDQLALDAVTVGAGTKGLWFAAFGDDVRFVLIDGVELAQSAVAPWVVAHLVAPPLAVAALVTGWLASRHSAQGRVGEAAGPA